MSSLTHYCFALIKVAQGKKKGSKKEEKKKAKDSGALAQAGARMQNVTVADERIMAHQQTAVADSIETTPAADVQVAQAKTSNAGLVVSSLIGCAFDVLLLSPCVHMPTQSCIRQLHSIAAVLALRTQWCCNGSEWDVPIPKMLSQSVGVVKCCLAGLQTGLSHRGKPTSKQKQHAARASTHTLTLHLQTRRQTIDVQLAF